MAPVFRDIFQSQVSLCICQLGLVYIYDIGEQAPLTVIERTDHAEFAQRLHRPIAIEVLHEFLYLLGGEKGKLFELFTRHVVHV